MLVKESMKKLICIIIILSSFISYAQELDEYCLDIQDICRFVIKISGNWVSSDDTAEVLCSEKFFFPEGSNIINSPAGICVYLLYENDKSVSLESFVESEMMRFRSDILPDPEIIDLGINNESNLEIITFSQKAYNENSLVYTSYLNVSEGVFIAVTLQVYFDDPGFDERYLDDYILMMSKSFVKPYLLPNID
jgi:hypothetical protein